MSRLRRVRSQKGTAFVDLAFASGLMIAMAIFCLNICVMMMTYGVNDRACRDAARAAAQGTNAVEAEKLARTILRTYQRSTGNFLAPPTIQRIVYNDFGGNPPAGVSPIVSVTTVASAKLPAPLEFFGKQISGDRFTMAKSYTFPVVRMNIAP